MAHSEYTLYHRAASEALNQAVQHALAPEVAEGHIERALVFAVRAKSESSNAVERVLIEGLMFTAKMMMEVLNV